MKLFDVSMLRWVRSKGTKVEAKTQSNQYQKNRNRLSFLPTVFFIFFVVGFVGLVTVLTFNHQELYASGLFSRVQTIKPTERIANQSSNQKQISNQASTNTELVKPQENSSGIVETQIHVNGLLRCVLVYDSEQPATIKPYISTSRQGWWVPKSCEDGKLKTIQIVELGDDQIRSLQGTLPARNFQMLDQTRKIYGIVYTTEGFQISYNLRTFVKGLLEPIFPDINVFDPVNVFDTRRLGDYTYYLEGGCQGQNSGACRLWRLHNFTGTYELLQEHVAETQKGGRNELSPGYVIRMAKVQDLVEGLIFIIADEKNTPVRSVKVVKTDISTGQILQTFETFAGEQFYRDYYR